MAIPVQDSIMREEEFLTFDTDNARIALGFGHDDGTFNTVTIYPLNGEETDHDFLELRIAREGKKLSVTARRKGKLIEVHGLDA